MFLFLNLNMFSIIVHQLAVNIVFGFHLYLCVFECNTRALENLLQCRYVCEKIDDDIFRDFFALGIARRRSCSRYFIQEPLRPNLLGHRVNTRHAKYNATTNPPRHLRSGECSNETPFINTCKWHQMVPSERQAGIVEPRLY